MEELITLLLHLVQKVPYLSEVEHDGEMALLRVVEEKLGVDGVVPPAAGPTNAPLAEAPPAPEVPGPVAEPVPPEQQTPPVASPEVVGTSPEQTNAFSSLVSDLSPSQRADLEAALAAEQGAGT